MTPEISDDDEDPYAVESLVFHGALNSGLIPYNQCFICTLCYSAKFCFEEYFVSRLSATFLYVEVKLFNLHFADTGGQRASVSQVKDFVCSALEGRETKPKFSHLSVSPCPLPIPLPFPSIFNSSIGQHGEILSNNHPEGTLPKGSLDVVSVPMAARLRSSNAIVPFIEKRSASLQRLGVARGSLGSQILREWGFGKEEVEDMGEHLAKMLRPFYPEMDLTSDSD